MVNRSKALCPQILPATLSVSPSANALGILILASLSLSLPHAAAQSTPAEITIVGRTGYPLAIQNLSGLSGKAATRTLVSDLSRYGHFNLRSATAGAFVASGTAQLDRIDGRLTAPNGATIFSRTYRSGDLRRDAHQLADDINFAIAGVPGIASSRIVFVSKRSGKKEIYICDYDGGNVRAITRDKSINASPTISPDRSRVAFTSYRNGYPDINLLSLRDGSRSRIISSPGTNSGATFSPRGDKIALTMSFTGNPELYVTNTRGSGARRVSRSRAIEASPAWFPNGRRLAFVSNHTGNPQIFEISARGGKPRLINVGFSYCTAPSVSPDGKRLALNVRRSGGMAILIHDLTNGKNTILTQGAEHPSWGADSKHVVYTRGSSLHIHNVDTDSSSQILSGLGALSEPSWSR